MQTAKFASRYRIAIEMDLSGVYCSLCASTHNNRPEYRVVTVRIKGKDDKDVISGVMHVCGRCLPNAVHGMGEFIASRACLREDRHGS